MKKPDETSEQFEAMVVAVFLFLILVPAFYLLYLFINYSHQETMFRIDANSKYVLTESKL